MTSPKQTNNAGPLSVPLYKAPHKITFDDVWQGLGQRPVDPRILSIFDANDLKLVRQDSLVKQAVCAVGMLDAQNEFTLVGTGFLINQRLMVTAGHVIARLILSGAQTIGIYAGLDGDNLPFPGVAMHRSEMLAHLKFPFGRTAPAQAGTFEDFAALQFSSLGFPQATVLPYRVYDDRTLRGLTITVTGYPSAQSPLHVDACYQYEHSGAINCDKDLLNYYIDTLPGQSGSPIWTNGPDGKPVVVGIHLAGQDKLVISSPNEGQYNWGTRVNSEVSGQLEAWLADVR